MDIKNKQTETQQILQEAFHCLVYFHRYIV